MTLTCVSTGGPATTVMWMKDNQILQTDGPIYRQEQRITDSDNATYENSVYAADAANLVGVFTCIVENARGMSKMSLSTNGV